MQGLERPPALCEGDLVRVVAPAGAFDRTLFFRGVGWLAHHFRVRFEAGLFARQGFLAGDDARRVDELNRALACERTRAVIAARGGYGCTRIAARVDFSPIERHPKWLVGFSDLTALHLELQQRGLRSLHAHNVTGLGPGDTAERERWLEPLLAATAPRSFLQTRLYPGGAEGPLWGGNLTVLCAALAAARIRPPDGCVLFLEEVGEAPYRLDRLLIQLEEYGVFERAAGVVSGYFSMPGSAPDDPLPILADMARRARVPWLARLPSGHERPNHPLELGAWARLSNETLHLS